MKFKLTALFILFTTILLSQNILNINSNWNGRHCNGGVGLCAIDISSKTQANTQMTYNSEHNELTLIISKTKLGSENKLKLTYNKLEQGFYLYEFDENFRLSNEILSQLNIKFKTKIKKGNYLIKETQNNFILITKLE